MFGNFFIIFFFFYVIVKWQIVSRTNVIKKKTFIRIIPHTKVRTEYVKCHVKSLKRVRYVVKTSKQCVIRWWFNHCNFLPRRFNDLKKPASIKPSIPVLGNKELGYTPGKNFLTSCTGFGYLLCSINVYVLYFIKMKPTW